MPLSVPTSTKDGYQEAFLQYVPTGAAQPLSIVFDAVLSEDWDEGASVTEHPVEQGANVSDHVRVNLPTCTLKVKVSNEPIDSNMFADPLGGAGGMVPAALSVPVWQSNQELRTQIGNIAGAVSDLAGNVADQLVNATPLGNLLAKAIRPVIVATADGNAVTTYPDIPLPNIDGVPVRSVGDAVGILTFGAILGLAPTGFSLPTPFLPSVVQFPQVQDFAQIMMAGLVNLKNKAQLFTVYGSKQTMASMVIETLQLHRGAPDETGSGADITIGFKVVRIVSTNTVAAPIPSLPRAATSVNKGAQDSSNAPVPQQQSVARAAKNQLLSWLSSGKIPGT